MARLSAYTKVSTVQKESKKIEVNRELISNVRAALYESVSSERIAQIVERGRERARTELTEAITQVLRDEQFSVLNALQRKSVVSELLNMILGLGPIEGLLNDDSITEVMVNGHENVFYEQKGRIFRSNETFTSEEQLRLVIDRIVSPLGRRIDEQSPIVNARLKEGHRVNAVIPPIAIDGSALTIRKFRKKAYSLQEMVDMDSMTQEIAQLLRWAVLTRKNIAVSGGTGGGKTTLLNALSSMIPHEERIVTIEDSAELRFDEHPHVVRMEARPANSEGNGEITIRTLVINALRMRPDRIVVGECRGAEAADMLQAMNTGHDGSLTTLHANSPAEVVSRLVMMVRYGMELPTQIIESQIASALDIVVQQDRVSGGHRRITQIVARNDNFSSDGNFFTPLCLFNKATQEYEWLNIPRWLKDLSYLNIASKKEVEEWKSLSFSS